ncbi:MAG: biopolymer transporter ExbD [Lentisphaerae bacterium]|jgi:biopolymer transport protein ExbD|nr:biopolymer transporter ExbD [Lentisphaerota bacterium]
MKALLDEAEEGSIRMTPLIDVVFLLLVFFLVATTFYEAEKDITIRLAGATEGAERDSTADLLVINIGEAGVIVINQRVYSVDELEALLRRGRARNPQLAAIIRCDRRARHADFVKVLNLCERTGVRQVAVATIQTDE